MERNEVDYSVFSLLLLLFSHHFTPFFAAGEFEAIRYVIYYSRINMYVTYSGTLA